MVVQGMRTFIARLDGIAEMPTVDLRTQGIE